MRTRATRSTLLGNLIAIALGLLVAQASFADDGGLKLATFDVDVTPPVGSMMAYDPVVRVDELSLRCRGIVLIGQGPPIVLCAVDWIGIANAAHDAFRERLAQAAGTTPQRVAVHTVHQHDAPGCDFTVERLLKDGGVKDLGVTKAPLSTKCWPVLGTRCLPASHRLSRSPIAAGAKPTSRKWLPTVASLARTAASVPHAGPPAVTRPCERNPKE